jgi:transketolase
MWQEEAKRVALGIRRRVFEHTIRNNGGYLSQACSSADFLATLYTHTLKLGPSIAPAVPRPFAGPPSATNPDAFTGAGYHGEQSAERDRFIISPAHYALVIYAALIESGRMDEKGLELFNQDGESVEMIGAEHSPGMEVMTGSLGQGLSQALGIAIARQRRGDSGRVWVFLSDGELQEGQTWEAFQVMDHYNLNNLAIIVDMNGQQCDGTVDATLRLGPVAERLRAFGAEVHDLDGHDMEAIAAAGSRRPEQGPLVLLANTDPCRGMSYLNRRRPKIHYVRFLKPGEKEALERGIREELYPEQKEDAA